MKVTVQWVETVVQTIITEVEVESADEEVVREQLNKLRIEDADEFYAKAEVIEADVIDDEIFSELEVTE